MYRNYYQLRSSRPHRFVSYNSLNFSYESMAEALVARDPNLNKGDLIKQMKKMSRKELRAMMRQAGGYDLDMAHREWKKYAEDGSNPPLPVLSVLPPRSKRFHEGDDAKLFLSRGEDHPVVKLAGKVYKIADSARISNPNSKKALDFIRMSEDGQENVKNMLKKPRAWAGNAKITLSDNTDDYVRNVIASGDKLFTDEQMKRLNPFMGTKRLRDRRFRASALACPAMILSGSGDVHIDLSRDDPAAAVHELSHARTNKKQGFLSGNLTDEFRANRMLRSLSSRAKNGHDAMAMRNNAAISDNFYLTQYPGEMTEAEFRKHDRKAGPYGVLTLTPEFKESEKRYMEALETE